MLTSITPVSVLAVFLATVASAGELLTDGRMEGPFSHGMARGWIKNCYGKNTANFSSGEPHSDASSQKIVCRSYEGGAIQLYHPLRLTKDKHYTITLWMRADGGVGMVNLALRHRPKPYTKHLGGGFEPGRQWEKFTLKGTVLDSDDNAGLFIWLKPAGPGTLWVDDVSVVEGGPLVLDLPFPQGNLIPNASFELDPNRDWRSHHVRPNCDTLRPFHGRRSLRWDLDDKNEEFVTRVIEFGGGGRKFTLSLAARANGRAEVAACLWPAVRLRGAKPVIRLECRPAAEWNEFRNSGTLPRDTTGAYYLAITIRPEEKPSQARTTVWLDAVRFEPGEAAGPSRCRRPVEASLASQEIAHIYRLGQPVELEIRAFNDGDQPCTAELLCDVVDYWRRPVARLPVSLDLRPRCGRATKIRVPIGKTGVYLAEIARHGEIVSELSFSVLPPASPVPPEQSAVGGHFRLERFHMKVANAMGIKWTRIHDCESITHWKTAEAEKGEFVWFDDKVRVAREHGVQILGEFLRVPKWASSAGPEIQGGDVHRRPPRNLDEFAAYVRAVVGHYKNDIRHWEIWNEPYHTGFWQGTAEEYAELAKVAARETHVADPRAVVLAPCAYPGAVDWVDRVLAAGGTADADVFSYHGYGVFNPKSYRRVRDWAGRGRRSPQPIWNTETGATSRTFYRHIPDKFVDHYTNWLRPLPYDVAAEHSAKLFVMALAGGARRYFQYWSVYEDSLLPRLSAMSIFEYDGSLRPMAVSYAVAASLLDGTRGQGFVKLPGPALANLLQDDDRLVAVLWRLGGRRPRPLAIPFDPAGLQGCNMMGQPVRLKPLSTGFEAPLSGEPLYLVVPAGEAESLVEALKAARMVK